MNWGQFAQQAAIVTVLTIVVATAEAFRAQADMMKKRKKKK
jgi:hypothetical protein